MEELDYPGEFFFDKRAEKLYLFNNGILKKMRNDGAPYE